MRKLPTLIKEQQGTLEKSRILDGEVEFDRCEGVPEAPESLDSFGAKVWIQSADNLLRRDILFKTDLPELEGYCTAAQIMRDCAKEMKDGEEGSKFTRYRKWFRYWKDAVMVMDKTGSKFGFSPVDKTNIAIPSVRKTGSLFK